MNFYLSELAARRRFGMRPGLETIRTTLSALGNPHEKVRAIHVAGTNGKGAVCAMLDAALALAGYSTGRYTSPHLVKLNERFFLNGFPLDDETLECAAVRVEKAASDELTFFEALTAVAFLVYAESACSYVVLETGLGGRLDATNICSPELCVITRIGLDHCDWLGGTIEKIATEKAGIIKTGVPIVLGRNAAVVRAIVESRAKEVGAPFYYAPELANELEIPSTFPLDGEFNRENAVTAIAALKVLKVGSPLGLSSVKWPGRFERLGPYVIDGAHNPPAARALFESLKTMVAPHSLTMIFGACGDKDVDEVLHTLAPLVAKGCAVRTNNPRSLSAEVMAEKMRAAGISTTPYQDISAALRDLAAPRRPVRGTRIDPPTILICGSLFLAGEALVALDAYSWPVVEFDPAELLKENG